MNLVFKYARKKCGNSRYRLLAYFEKLAMFHKKLIMKYCQLIDVEEVYSRSCVKKLPLTLSYKKSLPYCTDPKACTAKYRYDKNGKRWEEQDIKCLLCWIDTLEKSNTVINKNELLNIPPFLQSKSNQTIRPTSLLKKKELPNYLKK